MPMSGDTHPRAREDPVDLRNNLFDGFTKKYRVHRLVYFEFHENLLAAIAREKAIKQWKRFWKIKLIEQTNPTWKDLYDTLV